MKLSEKKLSLKPVQAGEVKKLILRMKPKFGNDLLGLSKKDLIAIQEGIVSPLTKIKKYSLNVGIFLDKLKHAVVVPIYKCGDKKAFQNDFDKVISKLVIKDQ